MSELSTNLQGESDSAGASVPRLHALNDRLAHYEKINWTALKAKDPADAQEFWLEFMRTREARDALLRSLRQRSRDEASGARRDEARRVEEAHVALAREVGDWNPELFDRVKELGAREFGFTPDEIAGVHDPRMLKVLYRVFIGDQGKGSAASEQASSEGSEEAISQTRENAHTGSVFSDEEQIEDWMRRRNDQLRRSLGPALPNRRR